MTGATVASFNTPPPAEALRRRLGDAGIPAVVHDERRLQHFWFLSRNYAGVRVRVTREHFEPARRRIAEWEGREPCLREAVRCPDCGSPEVQYPHLTRRFLLPTLLHHLFVLLGVDDHELYCLECHHTWTLAEVAQRRENAAPRVP